MSGLGTRKSSVTQSFENSIKIDGLGEMKTERKESRSIIIDVKKKQRGSYNSKEREV